MLIPVNKAAVGHRGEFAVPRGDARLRHALNQPLMPPPVGDYVRHAHNLDAMLLRERLQLRHARHRAVVRHYFADDARGLQPRQPRQIHHRLSLPGALENAALHIAQREYVAWPRQILRQRLRIYQRLDGRRAVVRRYAGGRAFQHIHRNRERRPQAGGVVIDHHRDAKFVKPLRHHRNAYQPAPLGRHEVDGVRRYHLRRHRQIALIFAVFVVHDYDHLPGLDVSYRILNPGQWHRWASLVVSAVAYRRLSPR